MTSKFRTSNGQRLTQNLFWETRNNTDVVPLYTLKDADHQGYPSLYALYIATGDLTEFEFASKYLESYSHWTYLCASPWFVPYVERWRRELELKLRSEALRRIIDTAAGQNKNTFAANKYLADRGWKTAAPKTTARGRPSKDEIHAAAVEIAQEDQKVRDDYDRLINPTTVQ